MEKAKYPEKISKALGPISDLERHLPSDWWSSLFNSLYLKTDGDVVENSANTVADVNLLISALDLKPSDALLDVCCGQGRHSLELARRGFNQILGVDRSRYLIRLARKRNKDHNLKVQFSEGDARKLRVPRNSRDAVFLMGNSFGYFEREEDDVAVLSGLLEVLKSEGKLLLDVVDGEWMSKNFEPRSWEWIDQVHFVNRERALAADGKRIITREVITNSNVGVIADQFYAERLYQYEELESILKRIGFHEVKKYGLVQSESTRGQDFGMMAHRVIITCRGPQKQTRPSVKKQREVTVIMGDPTLPDKIKKGGVFNQEDLDTVERLKEALSELGDYRFKYLTNHKTLINQLISHPPDFVFNLCDEGFRNDATLELHVPALLEILKVPYTGAAPGSLSLCYDKSKVRSIAQTMDIPVPDECFWTPEDQAANIPNVFPALLKPACGDSSMGITQNAVVTNATELMDYLNYLKENFSGSAVLIQEFLRGAEYSVALIGNPGNLEALPVLEVDYSKLPENLPKILSYESKWLPDSPFWTEISYHEARITEDVRGELITYSKKLFERLECRDYARFDFRCDSNGTPKLLEVNPNPGWCWDGKLNLMAGYAGMRYPDLLKSIINAGLERAGDLNKSK